MVCGASGAIAAPVRETPRALTMAVEGVMAKGLAFESCGSPKRLGRVRSHITRGVRSTAGS
jgi:hypothetical protein